VVVTAREFKFQYFISPEQGELLRLPIDWTARRWPQYAGTEQRILQLILVDGAVRSVTGTVARFKATGDLDQRLELVTKRGRVPDLRQYRRMTRAIEEDRKLRWQPSAADSERLIAHLFGGERIPYVTRGKN